MHFLYSIRVLKSRAAKHFESSQIVCTYRTFYTVLHCVLFNAYTHRQPQTRGPKDILEGGRELGCVSEVTSTL